jgi:hypothetical protein
MNLKGTKARQLINWLDSALDSSHAGMLHKALKVKIGTKLPLAKLKSAAKGDSVLAHRARIALSMRASP